LQSKHTFDEIRVQRYLERIGITGEIKADYNSLRLIQERHMLSIPFENLNIVNELPVHLNASALFDKIVTRSRGGYCYELNGLLALVLRSLGYSVTLLSGQVLRDDGTSGPEFDHMVLLVHLHEDYIVDVGFGDSVRSPLPLSGKVVVDVSGSYRIIREQDSDVHFFQKRHSDEWMSEFQFTQKPRQMGDFSDMNLYQQTSPDSHFTKNLIISIATPNGRVSISRDSFIETVGTDKKRRTILSDDERNDLLKRHFGIDVV
jgi:N-hydroxyarylamine O-acetyltransferase